MTDQAASAGATTSPKTILLSMGGALAGAILILFLFVLPAEIGFDPLGSGRLLGLTGLANPPSAALTAQTQGMRTDEIEFTLEPFQSVEYKYELAEGAGLTFSWSADGEVYYDMHAEPEGAEPGYAESFAIGAAARQDGVYVPTFPGIHGWFWENRGASAVTVRLESAGFMTGAIVFQSGDRSGGRFRNDQGSAAVLYLAFKTVISAALIVAVSEVAKRSPTVGALVASLPLISILAMIWLWRETGDNARVAAQAQATFWYVLPSLPMFLAIPALMRAGLGFWPALAAGVALTGVLYLAMTLILSRFGVTL